MIGVTGISPVGIPRDSSNGRTLLQFGAAADATVDAKDDTADGIVGTVEPCTTVGTVDDNPWPTAMCRLAKNMNPMAVNCDDNPIDEYMTGFVWVCNGRCANEPFFSSSEKSKRSHAPH